VKWIIIIDYYYDTHQEYLGGLEDPVVQGHQWHLFFLKTTTNNEK